MSQNLKVALTTLGCKLNYSETSTVSRQFKEEGYERVDHKNFADVYVINTCTVTNNSDSQIIKDIKRLKKNTFRMPKGGNYYKGFVHVEDAVGSIIAILEKQAFGESFIIADSMPVSFKEFSNFAADQISAKHPGSVPVFLAKAVLGSDLIKLLTTPIKVSNKKILKIYDFKYPNYKEGIKQVIAQLKENDKL